MRKTLNILAIAAVALALTACNGVYKGMPGDGTDFQVVRENMSGPGAGPVSMRIPVGAPIPAGWR